MIVGQKKHISLRVGKFAIRRVGRYKIRRERLVRRAILC